MNRRNEYSEESRSGGARPDRSAQDNRSEHDQHAEFGDRGEPPYDISDEDYAPMYSTADDGRIDYDDAGVPDDQREHRRFAESQNQQMRFGAGNHRRQSYASDFEGGETYRDGTHFPGMERYSPERASPPPNTRARSIAGHANEGNFARPGRGSDSLRYRNEREANYRYPSDASMTPRSDDYGEGDDYFVGYQARDGGGFASVYGSPARPGGTTDLGFRGLGPKNYVRSDERIREDVSERLADDAQVDASDISVEVRNGKVTLSGRVSDRRIKHRVEDLVDRCNGVQEIDNRLSVASSRGTISARDSTITNAAPTSAAESANRDVGAKKT